MSISRENYTAFVRSIYSTYAASDEKVREVIRAKIREKIGIFYCPSERPNQNNAICVFDFDIDKKELAILHSHTAHGQGTGSIKFKLNEAIITIRPPVNSSKLATEIIVDNETVSEESQSQLANFLSQCELHTIPELAQGFHHYPSLSATVEESPIKSSSAVSTPNQGVSPKVKHVRQHQTLPDSQSQRFQPPQQYIKPDFKNQSFQPAQQQEEKTFPQYQSLPFSQPQYAPQEHSYQQYQTFPFPPAEGEDSPQYQSYPSVQQQPADHKAHRKIYTSKRYDNNINKKPSIPIRCLTRSDIETDPFFNKDRINKPGYKAYKGIHCIDLTKATQYPGLFWRFNHTKVQINEGEVGLITHNNKEEILAPGIYYFTKSTVLNTDKGKGGKVKTSAPLIEHGNIKVVTVPRGHLEHVFMPVGQKNKRFIMKPGRYFFDNNADKVKRVVNPYGLKTSLENDKTTFLITVPEGKVGLGKIKQYSDLLQSDVQTYLPGKNLVDTDIEEFEDLTSTKIQTATINKISIPLQDGTIATADAVISYVIPDESKRGHKVKSSLQKVVENFGRTEDVIKEQIENPEKGLAIQAIRAQCANLTSNRLLQDNEVIISNPEDDLNVTQNRDYKGVQFLSVTFNNITFDQKRADQLSTSAIAKIEQHLRELDDKESDAYIKMRKGILCDLGLAQIPETKVQSDKNLPQHVKKRELAELNGEADEKRNEAQPHKLPSEITLSPENSADYFKGTPRLVEEGGNYQSYVTRNGKIPCISDSYLKSLSGWLCTSQWLNWLPNRITGNQQVEVKADEIGLIRINGKPELLKPGKYNLPSSIEWVRSEKILSDENEKIIIQHDSITIANIPAGDTLYVEDNTLYEDGSLKEYSYLDKGIHVIDSPTMTHREVIVDCVKKTRKVKQTADENDRLIERKYELCLEEAPQAPTLPVKRKLYLRSVNGYIGYTMQDSKGARADGVLNIEAPRTFTMEALRKLEIQILHELAENKHIPSLEKDKLLTILIGPTEAGIFYDAMGNICIAGPGELEMQEGWTFYKKIPLEGTQKVTVEAYTADNIRVEVKATVHYQLPIQQLQDAIRRAGVNKIENEIARVAKDAVTKQVRSLDYIAAAKITCSESQELQTSFLSLSKEAHQKILRSNLRKLMDSGIAIVDVQLDDQITPTDPKVRMALLKILNKKADIREAIKDEHREQLHQQMLARVHQQEMPRPAQQSSNDAVSAPQLQTLGINARRQTQPLYQPYLAPTASLTPVR